MTSGYQEVYSDVASQRKSISEKRKQLNQPVVGGSAKQQRIVMRRVVRSPSYHKYAEEKRRSLSELSSAESSLSSYESKIREYEKQGYDVERTPEGELRFSKQVYHPGERVVVGPREQSVVVKWEKYQDGRVVDSGSVRTTNVRYDSVAAELERRGRSITEVTAVGGGRTYKTDEGYYTTEDVVLAKAEPIYSTVDVSRDEKQLGDVTVRHIGMDKKLDLGFGRRDIKKTSTNDAELAMIRQSNISRVDTMREMTKSAIVAYYAIPEEERKMIEAGLSPGERLAKKYGENRLDIYVAKHIEDIGIPGLIAGVQTLTGIDKDAWSKLNERYASEFLLSARKKNESILNYTSRFWTSEEAIRNVYIPIATVGAGYVAKPFMVGAKTISTTSKLFPITSRLVYYAPSISKIMITGVIGTTAAQVIMNPSESSLIIGRNISSLTKMYGGFYSGGKLYKYVHPRIIYESYWTGTQYEQNILDSLHKRSVLSSQYKPYEFGSPSSRFTAEIKPSWQKFPYVPKTPVEVHTMTFGMKDTSGSNQAFFVKKHMVSSRDISQFESSPITIKIREKITGGKEFNVYKTKDFTFNVFSGEVSVKGSTSRVIGFSSSRYLGDVSSDVAAYRTYSYSSSLDYVGKPSISRGITFSKTFYNEPEVTLGFSSGKTTKYQFFDVSKVIKSSLKSKESFGGYAGFDYGGLQTKLVDDVIMPGGIHTDVGLKIELSSPFSSLRTKQLNYINQVESSYPISSHWKDVFLSKSILPVSVDLQIQKNLSLSTQKLDVVSSTKTMQINLNIEKDIQKQINLSLSGSSTKSLSASTQKMESLSIVKQLQVQQQKTKLQSKQLFVNLLDVSTMPSSGRNEKFYYEQGVSTRVEPPPIIPFYFDLPESEVKKPKKTRQTYNKMMKGYRYRSWKVPTMKEFIGM